MRNFSLKHCRLKILLSNFTIVIYKLYPFPKLIILKIVWDPTFTDELEDNLVELDTSYIKNKKEIYLEGFVTKPGYTRNNRREQLFYLNGRAIRFTITLWSREKGI